MVDDTTWKEMKQHAFEAYANEGRMDVHVLEKLVEIGCANGGFDDNEKAVMINVIASLTRADMHDAMWAKVDELIHKFDLGHDNEATMEHVAEDHHDEP
ncbi:MAG: hypothetical protein GQ538_05755 [Xanthomonadales bacterium]|nr:hypothetical protein [Xanthomonadales bacterium]